MPPERGAAPAGTGASADPTGQGEIAAIVPPLPGCAMACQPEACAYVCAGRVREVA